MSKSWVEKSFIMYFRHRYPTGPMGRRLKVFGKDLIGMKDTRNPLEALTSGFMLSCHVLVIAREPTKERILGRFTNIPLLALLLGERKLEEVVVERFEYREEGIDYQFEKLHRWEAFSKFPWLSIKGSKYDAYRVVTEHEGVANFTFMPKVWREGNITPSPPMILQHARALDALQAEMVKDLTAIKDNFDEDHPS